LEQNLAAGKTEKRPAEKFPRKAIPIYEGKSEEETQRNFAAMVTAAETAAYRVVMSAERKSGLGDPLDVPSLMAQLRSQAAAVQGGSLAQVEAILINQATALQSLFARLSERGMASESLATFEGNMRMALRAQSQCRATLETLAMIKNPPVVYARQANIAQGGEQWSRSALARAGNRKSAKQTIGDTQ
jgi:hypothetical protein